MDLYPEFSDRTLEIPFFYKRFIKAAGQLCQPLHGLDHWQLQVREKNTWKPDRTSCAATLAALHDPEGKLVIYEAAPPRSPSRSFSGVQAQGRFRVTILAGTSRSAAG
jgi:hypothetical protein